MLCFIDVLVPPKKPLPLLQSAMKACPMPLGLASEFPSKIGRQESKIIWEITNELYVIYMLTLLVRNVSGLVKMAFGLVDAGYSLPE